MNKLIRLLQGAAGGGASDIRTSMGDLSINDTRIVVAGGGGNVIYIDLNNMN